MGALDWNSPEQTAAREQKWQDELVRRFQAGCPLTAEDRKQAQRIMRQRAEATGECK
jgi:hypothetical protein